MALHVLGTCAAAALVCLVAIALGHGRNVPLILLAAPVVGLLSATSLRWAHRSDGAGEGVHVGADSTDDGGR